jgi:hypothetical protein
MRTVKGADAKVDNSGCLGIAMIVRQFHPFGQVVEVKG